MDRVTFCLRSTTDRANKCRAFDRKDKCGVPGICDRARKDIRKNWVKGRQRLVVQRAKTTYLAVRFEDPFLLTFPVAVFGIRALVVLLFTLAEPQFQLGPAFAPVEF